MRRTVQRGWVAVLVLVPWIVFEFGSDLPGGAWIAQYKAGIVFGGYSRNVGRTRSCSFLNNTTYRNDALGEGLGELWSMVMRIWLPLSRPVNWRASAPAPWLLST